MEILLCAGFTGIMLWISYRMGYSSGHCAGAIQEIDRTAAVWLHRDDLFKHQN